MKTVAILYICTGKYIVFWKDFFNSVEANFLTDCKVEYFVFTDQEVNPVCDRVTWVECSQMGWPFDTLMRFRLFSEIKDELRRFDYLIFMNANLLVLGKVTSDILPIKRDFLGIIHPGFYNKRREQFTYERSSKSLACMALTEGNYYFMGSLSGGKSKPYIELSERLARNIEIDLQNGIVAVWHDESYLNRYFWECEERVKKLSASYAYPEDWELPFEKKILIRDKMKFGGHGYLRKEYTPR